MPDGILHVGYSWTARQPVKKGAYPVATFESSHLTPCYDTANPGEVFPWESTPYGMTTPLSMYPDYGKFTKGPVYVEVRFEGGEVIQNGQGIGRRLEAGDDVGGEPVGVPPSHHRPGDAERLDDLPRRRREALEVGRDQWARAGDLVGEERRPLALRHRPVAGGHAGRGEDLADGGRMALGVVAQVESREVEAEDLDLSDDVAQLGAGDQVGTSRVQGAGDEAEVGQQLV